MSGIIWTKVQDLAIFSVLAYFKNFQHVTLQYNIFWKIQKVCQCIIHEIIAMNVVYENQAELLLKNAIHNDYGQLFDLYPLTFPGNFQENRVFDVH